MIKKLLLGTLLAIAIPATLAYAATPMLTVQGSGDNNSVIVNVTGGDVGAPVVLYYTSAINGGTQSTTLGTTNASGTFSGNFNTSNGVNRNMPVYVLINGYQSGNVTWPYTYTGTTSNGTTSTTNISFSPSTMNVSTGQNGTVTLSGGSGTYYISSNSNAGGVTPTINGNTLTLNGGATGQASIVVCSTGGGCGTITTTTNGSTGAAGSPVLSSSNLNVNQGSQGSITLSGGTAPYNVSVVNGTGVSTTLSGNTLYVNGNATGTNTINVCSSNGVCSTLNVNVQSQVQNPANTGTGGMSFTLPLTLGQSISLPLNGGTGSYFIQGQGSNVMASINGNTLMLNGQNLGTGTVTVCQTGGTACLPITFTVNQPTTSTPSTPGATSGYTFDMNLSYGMSGTAVMELQNRLAAEGFFNVTANGRFGPATQAAVRAYQSAHGISAVGAVGPQTRVMLNQ